MKAKKIITATKNIDLDIVSTTLLTVEEAEQLPDKVLNSVRGGWWLCSPGHNGLAACVFGGYGIFYVDGDYVCKELGVRPVITFTSSDLEVGDKFVAFNYEWTVVFPNKALCDDVIGHSLLCDICSSKGCPYKEETCKDCKCNLNREDGVKGDCLKEINEGEWIVHYNDIFPIESTEECSICHAEQYINGNDDNYCPNCGVKMK